MTNFKDVAILTTGGTIDKIHDIVTESPTNFLNEMWRVLTPNGRLVMVLPNRRGVWARFDHTPFGRGQPYSKTQAYDILTEAGFSINAWQNALFYPPFERYLRLGFTRAYQRIGARLWPGFSGVIVVDAQKRLYRGLPVVERASRRVFVPVLQPQGVGARSGSIERDEPH